MKIGEWIIGVVVAVITAAIVWGNTRTTIDVHEKRLTNIEGWRDKAADQLARLDEKLDMLLEANGLTYRNKNGRNNQ